MITLDSDASCILSELMADYKQHLEVTTNKKDAYGHCMDHQLVPIKTACVVGPKKNNLCKYIKFATSQIVSTASFCHHSYMNHQQN
jgi:hypothetical protein